MALTLSQRLEAFRVEVAAKDSQQDRQIAYLTECQKAMVMGDWAWAETLLKAVSPNDTAWTRKEPAYPKAEAAQDAAPYVRVADVSNYAGYLSSDQVVALAEEGVEHVIVRISLEDQARRNITHQQLSILRAHGIPVSGYFFPDYDAPPIDIINAVMALAGEVRTLWVDVEPSQYAPLPDAAVIERWVRDAYAVCPVELGVYSSAWCWPKDADLSEFALWDANYGPFAGLEVSYGGWTKAAGVQHQNTSTVGGVSCDLSYFDSTALAS